MKWVKLLWRWSWVLTFPVAVIFIYWSGVTFDRYTTFSIKFPSLFSNLYSYGEMEFRHLVRQSELAMRGTVNGRSGESTSLKTINLFVSESNLAQLNDHLPLSGFEYVDGGLWVDGKLHKVKIKYRGDNSFHWEYYKKSLRVKTKKSYLFEGMRSFNLVVPKFEEKLHNYLGYQFAKELGLVAPKSELVNVSLNGKLIGVYVLVEKLEELTLRNNKFMPADIYSGELVGMDQYYGISPEVFLHPRLWGKDAINNHYQADSVKPLEKLVELVNSKDSEVVQRELSRLIDLKAWGRFSAYETLTQSFHFDDQHNWRIYYDPYRRTLLPIVWDPVAWHNDWRPEPGESAQMDILTSRLHTVLFKNGDFLRARQQAIEDFYAARKDVLFLQEVDKAIESITPALRDDPNIRPTNPQRSIDAMQRLRAGIEGTFASVKKEYLEELGEIDYASSVSGVLRLRVDGRRLLTALVFNYAEPVTGPVKAHLRYMEDGKEIKLDITGSVSVEGNRITVSQVLLPQFVSIFNDHARTRYQRHRKKVLPGYYELSLTGVDRSNPLFEVLVERGDDLVLARKVKELKMESFKGMYRIASEQPLLLPKIWEGEIVIKDSIEMMEPLIIRPGTTVRFASGATVILRNSLLAEGTAEKPIRFLPAVSGQDPWGAFVLWGDAAKGSHLEHCEFAGGSGLKGDLFEYTAMFSIHDVKGVDVENCKFRDSKITDDMVHAVYSKVHFKGCTFERSLMDALDVDISEVVIEGCHFIDSGNDSIDLMTSTAVVVDTLVENAGDKAASVGEGSYLFAINNVFRNNLIGVQAKDGSVASLYNVSLTGNEHALDAYKKNWRYNDGGKIFLYKSSLVGNKKMITADKKSRIRVYDTYIDKPVEVKKKRVKLADTVDSENVEKAKNNKLDRNKREIELMKDIDSHYLQHVDPSRRGALISAGN